MRLFLGLLVLLFANPLLALEREQIVKNHVLPRYEALVISSVALSHAAAEDCSAESEDLRMAYHQAFDAWIGVSHLRFGPSERDNRAFALAFWPDPRSKTPKALAGLLASSDPIGLDAVAYREMSIAARGFYALEFLLFDETTQNAGTAEYLCTLTQTVINDIAANAIAIQEDWLADYAAVIITPSETGQYRTDDEANQEFLKALATGLQFTSEARLGRPLGTFDRPRPKRAENWRSARPARNVDRSLRSLSELALMLSDEWPTLSADFTAAFDRALSQLNDLNDPTFATVSDPTGRFKIEIVQTSVDQMRSITREKLGPLLGVKIGFNALDGD